MSRNNNKRIYIVARKLAILIVPMLIISCSNNRWRNIEIISPDGSDTLSIKTIENKRYVFNGVSDEIPINHALIDISDVTELGDEIGICWNKDGYNWKLVSFYAKFEYNRLDTSKFYIQEKAMIDDRGIPNHDEYFKEKCVVIYPKGNIVRPKNGARLIYK